MESKPIYYSIWLVADQKWSAIVLGLVAVCVCLTVWHYGGPAAAVAGLVLILFAVWYIFLPVRLEINSHGIIRSALGRKWIIRWSDIRGYQIRYNGLLLLAHRDRFALDPLCAFFLPIPRGLMTEVLFRFRQHIGE
jgi:hypothetical protein